MDEHYGDQAMDATEVQAAEKRLVEAVEGLGQALEGLEHRLEHVLRYPTPQVISATIEQTEEVHGVNLKLTAPAGTSPLTDFLSAQAAAVNMQTGRVSELIGRLAI